MASNDNNMLSITEVSEKYNISRQAIMLVIKSGRLTASKKRSKWFFTYQDWERYQESKYDRKFSLRKGVPLYDETLGKISPKMVADNLNVKIQRIYYLIRKNKIPAEKVGGAYVIDLKEIEEIKELIKTTNTRIKSKDGVGNKSDSQRRRKNTYKKISRI